MNNGLPKPKKSKSILKKPRGRNLLIEIKYFRVLIHYDLKKTI